MKQKYFYTVLFTLFIASIALASAQTAHVCYAPYFNDSGVCRPGINSEYTSNPCASGICQWDEAPAAVEGCPGQPITFKNYTDWGRNPIDDYCGCSIEYDGVMTPDNKSICAFHPSQFDPGNNDGYAWRTAGDNYLEIYDILNGSTNIISNGNEWYYCNATQTNDIIKSCYLETNDIIETIKFPVDHWLNARMRPEGSESILEFYTYNQGDWRNDDSTCDQTPNMWLEVARFSGTSVSIELTYTGRVSGNPVVVTTGGPEIRVVTDDGDGGPCYLFNYKTQSSGYKCPLSESTPCTDDGTGNYICSINGNDFQYAFPALKPIPNYKTFDITNPQIMKYNCSGVLVDSAFECTMPGDTCTLGIKIINNGVCPAAGTNPTSVSGGSGSCVNGQPCFPDTTPDTSSGTQGNTIESDFGNYVYEPEKSFICYNNGGKNNYISQCCTFGECKNSFRVSNKQGNDPESALTPYSGYSRAVRAFGNGASIRSPYTFDYWDTSVVQDKNYGYSNDVEFQLPDDMKDVANFGSISFEIIFSGSGNINLSFLDDGGNVLDQTPISMFSTNWFTSNRWHRIYIPGNQFSSLTNVKSLKIKSSDPNEYFYLDNIYFNDKPFVCSGYFGEWIDELDPVHSNITGTERPENYVYEWACEARSPYGWGWTGNHCCGDDTFGTDAVLDRKEYFNDDLAGCFGGYKISNESTVSETLNSDGFKDLLYATSVKESVNGVSTNSPQNNINSFYQCNFASNMNNYSFASEDHGAGLNRSVHYTDSTIMQTSLGAFSLNDSGCGTNDCVVKLSSATNAHAETCDSTTPGYKYLCYDENIGGDRITANEVTIHLSNSDTNAHVSNIPGMTPNIRLPNNNNLNCAWENNACTQGRAAVISLSSETNAHISFGDSYPVKYCCNIQSATPVPEVPLPQGPPVTRQVGACSVSGEYFCGPKNKWSGEKVYGYPGDISGDEFNASQRTSKKQIFSNSSTMLTNSGFPMFIATNYQSNYSLGYLWNSRWNWSNKTGLCVEGQKIIPDENLCRDTLYGPDTISFFYESDYTSKMFVTKGNYAGLWDGSSGDFGEGWLYDSDLCSGGGFFGDVPASVCSPDTASGYTDPYTGKDYIVLFKNNFYSVLEVGTNAWSVPISVCDPLNGLNLTGTEACNKISYGTNIKEATFYVDSDSAKPYILFLLDDSSVCVGDYYNSIWNWNCTYHLSDISLPYSDMQIPEVFSIYLPNYFSGSVSGCCPERFCWDGLKCIDGRNMSRIDESLVYAIDQYIDTSGHGVVCKEGNWTPVERKYTPHFDDSGFCADNSKCYWNSDPLNTESEGACINNQTFVEENGEYYDFYCNNGNWQSKTSLIADKLLGVANDEAGGNAFSLNCGDKHESLDNEYANITSVYIALSSFAADTKEPGVNAVCVLIIDENNNKRFGDKNDILILGAALTDNLTDLRNEIEGFFPTGSCDENGDDYEKCTDNLFYNPKTKSIIFSQQNIGSYNIAGRTGFSRFLERMADWFKDFLGISSRVSGWGDFKALLYESSFNSSNLLYNNIYYFEDNDKQVAGVKEYKYEDDMYKYAVYANYQYFNIDICDVKAINGLPQYFAPRLMTEGAKSSITCNETQGVLSSTIIEELDPSELDNNYWEEMSGASRPKTGIEAPEEICTPENNQYYMQCDGDWLYWYNDCGQRTNAIEFCQNGCQNSACVVAQTCDLGTYTDCHNGQFVVEKSRCDDSVVSQVQDCGSAGCSVSPSPPHCNAMPTDTYTLTVTIAGGGSVTASPNDLWFMGVVGTAEYESGASATITATPSSGYTFSGWSGACSGTGSCQLFMFSDKSVTATFTPAGGGGGGGGAGGAIALQNGVAYQGTLPAAVGYGSNHYYYIDVTGSPTNLEITLTGLNADADLFEKFGAQPTLSSYDRGSTYGGNYNELINIPNPQNGRYYMLITNFQSNININYQVKATYTPSGGGGGGAGTTQCIDPDNSPSEYLGFDNHPGKYVKSTTYDIYSVTNTDYCFDIIEGIIVNKPSGNNVMEFYCRFDSISNRYVAGSAFGVSCNCVDGACI